MTSFRTQLLFALISLILLVLIGLGVLIGELFKSYYPNALQSRFEKEVSIIVSQVEQQSSLQEISTSQFDEISDVLDMRITILDEQDTTVYDSENNGLIERHEEMIETIQEDQLNQSDVISRYQVEEDIIYYAQGITIGDTTGVVVIGTTFDELKDVYRQIWIILSITLGLALLIIILIGSKITNRYTKPIDSATKVAIELAKGNYRARTYEDRVDESGKLSNAINILARNLQEMINSQTIQQDRLQTLIENMGSGLIMIDRQGYIVLVNRPFLDFFHMKIDDVLNERYVDIFSEEKVQQLAEEVFMTEQRVRRQLHLSASYDQRHLEVYGAPIIGKGSAWRGIILVFHDISELKMLEQMRKDFVANVSHEVKTPITSIKGFTETLLDGAMADEKALHSFLSIILKESDRLQALIQDLLELSKVEQQGFKLNISTMDLRVLLQEVKTMMEQKASQKGMTISLLGSDQSFIEGDQDRLKQVFINLVSNAMTYSQPNGEIRVLLQDEEDRVLIRVEDDGIGMDEQEIPRIFERFYRVDKARSRNSGGTGLGLAIVKHIIEVHAGEITVESTPDEGTAFDISLPKNIKNRM
ncbi:two-component system histidine kinase PnpS [Jeotgalibacillus marinus]|uniref:histidine kinase n=1 Tax=Jeotgalibacillus marinus TaxID=86667 RepID=A0ABV3Q046_9BACL